MLKIADWNLCEDCKEWENWSRLKIGILDNYNVTYSVKPTLYLDMSLSTDALWQNLSYKSCRYCINKALKNGLYTKIIDDKSLIPDFCRVHYRQLMDVCKRHGMKPKPSQSENRMRSLCESLFPERVMMIQCCNNNLKGGEQILSSGIFCIDKSLSVYWTGASFMSTMNKCPNELMVWNAIKELKNRGVKCLNFAGTASYKLKFGTKYAAMPVISFYRSKYYLNSAGCVTFGREPFHPG